MHIIYLLLTTGNKILGSFYTLAENGFVFNYFRYISICAFSFLRLVNLHGELLSTLTLALYALF